MKLTSEDLAQLCHALNRSIRVLYAQSDPGSWREATEQRRDSIREGVAFKLEHPEISAAEQHEQWLLTRKSQGWKLGSIEDESMKTHPNLVPYGYLPISERVKDVIFGALVEACRSSLEPADLEGE